MRPGQTRDLVTRNNAAAARALPIVLEGLRRAYGVTPNFRERYGKLRARNGAEAKRREAQLAVYWALREATGCTQAYLGGLRDVPDAARRASADLRRAHALREVDPEFREITDLLTRLARKAAAREGGAAIQIREERAA